MGREGVPEGVTAGFLGDLGGGDGSADGALEDGFVEVVAMSLAGDTVAVDSGGGGDPLPGPVAAGVPVFLGECMGEGDVPGALGAVLVVLFVYALNVRGEFSLEEFRQKSDAVLTAFARTRLVMGPMSISRTIL